MDVPTKSESTDVAQFELPVGYQNGVDRIVNQTAMSHATAMRVVIALMRATGESFDATVDTILRACRTSDGESAAA